MPPLSGPIFHPHTLEFAQVTLQVLDILGEALLLYRQQPYFLLLPFYGFFLHVNLERVLYHGGNEDLNLVVIVLQLGHIFGDNLA